jgi:hypothetical protein
MALPFTLAQFLNTFARYNAATWPAPWVLGTLAVGAVAAAARGGPTGSRFAAAVIGVLWLWAGAVYHLGFFRAVNPAATLFGLLFLAQGLLVLWLGAMRGALRFRAGASAGGIVGAVLMIYALVLYPLLGAALGHTYPAAATFGAPCPVVIFTFGLLAWRTTRVPWWLLVVPALWAAIGTMAALQLGMREDLGLLVAAVAALPLIARGTGRGGDPARALR